VISALEKRGLTEEAQVYQFYATVYLDFIHGIPESESMEMPIDDVVALLSLPPKPTKYAGWNFWHGKAAIN